MVLFLPTTTVVEKIVLSTSYTWPNIVEWSVDAITILRIIKGTGSARSSFATL